MQAVIGRMAIMDALLDLAVAMSVFWWFRALETGRDDYFIYGCLATALGFLAKGPVAPVVSILVMVPFALWNNRHERLYLPSVRGWMLGLGGAVCVVAPWLVAIAGIPAFARG